MSNFRTIDRQTGFLLPPSVDEWLPEKHLARFLVEVIEGLDLRAMSGSYRGSGSASYHPRMLLGILVYGSDLDSMIGAIVDELAPSLVARNSIGHGAAAQLLLTAGDNVQRLQSDASFAALCGVRPVPASSGKTTRHRLNRGGDRAANSSLHIIAIGRLWTDPRTKVYMAKRIAEGHSKLEIIRCLKCYIAREVFTLIKPTA